jgi:hypothetical protein
MRLRYKRCRARDCEYFGRWMPPCIPIEPELPDVYQEWQPRAHARTRRQWWLLPLLFLLPGVPP